MIKKKEKVLFEGEWLKLKQLTFLNRENKKITWETIERKNTKKIVVVIAKLKPSNRLVLIEQFRPPLNKSVIGFPAGLAKSNNIKKEALKELKEETGYFGKIMSVSPDLAFNPAMTSELVNIVYAQINELAPKNLCPKQTLEPEEQIEVLLIKEPQVKAYLSKALKKGKQVSTALWYLFNQQI